MAEVMNDDVADLRTYLRTLKRQRWVIVVTAVIAVVVAVVISLVQTPVYQATAQILVQQNTLQTTLSSSPPDAATAARNVDTEAAILSSKLIMDVAAKQLGHKPTITISSNSATSDVVSVNARSTDGRRAASDANGYTTAYLSNRQSQELAQLQHAEQQLQAEINTTSARLASLPPGSPDATAATTQLTFLQGQLNQLQVAANLNNVGGPQVLDRAAVPTSPVSPQPLRNVAIALALGLLLGVALAFLREYLNDTITSREDLESATDQLPVLGEIPLIKDGRHRGKPFIATLEEPNSIGAEAFRTLRTSIQFLDVDRDLQCVQFTSATAVEGKTTVLVNLAAAFARTGRAVSIVGLDLRRPRIHEFFGLENEVGFTSVLLGDASVSQATRRVPLPAWAASTGQASLVVLPSGPPPPNPSELLLTQRTQDIISQLAQAGQLVLIDSPPVLPVSDALIISGLVDATLLVASAGSSSRRSVRRATQVLRRVKAPLLGTVLNKVTSGEGYDAGLYEYAPYSDEGEKAPSRRRGRAEEDTEP